MGKAWYLFVEIHLDGQLKGLSPGCLGNRRPSLSVNKNNFDVICFSPFNALMVSLYAILYASECVHHLSDFQLGSGRLGFGRVWGKEPRGKFLLRSIIYTTGDFVNSAKRIFTLHYIRKLFIVV